MAAVLVTRDAFVLAQSLRPVTGDFFSRFVFGIGVLGMALSSITLMMVISGFVVCEVLNKPHTGWPFRLGSLLAGVDVYTTEMWTPRQMRDPLHRRTLDHPELYGFIEISQGNHNRREEHWADLQWIRSYLDASPRPLNNVKIYGSDMSYPLNLGYNYCCDQDAIERFWRNLLGGAASVRFHRPPAGIGLGVRAQRQIRSARMLLSDYDLARALPDAGHARLSDREENEAYLSYVEGEQYAVYFPDGGAVRLETGTAGPWTLRWLEVAASRWHPRSAASTGREVALRAPGGGGWVALLTRP